MFFSILESTEGLLDNLVNAYWIDLGFTRLEADKIHQAFLIISNFIYFIISLVFLALGYVLGNQHKALNNSPREDGSQ